MGTGTFKIGILGGTRGLEFAMAAKKAGIDANFTAVCENYPPLVEKIKTALPALGFNPTIYTDYDEMLESAAIDGVIIANNATEHAPFAIKALDHGINVLSEVLPCQTMSQAIALVEAVERSGKRYSYAENYCYMAANFQIARKFRSGEIGNLVEAEADFINDCSQRWGLLTRGLRWHWRNHVPATFYCTHSLAPLYFATRRRPVRVTGFEIKNQDYMRIHGARNGSAALEMVELDDGSFFKSLHGNLKRPWASRVHIFGTKGSLESRDVGNYTEYLENGNGTGYGDYDTIQGDFKQIEGLPPMVAANPEAFILWSFIGATNGDRMAIDYGIDIYQAIDMFLPGLFAYRSIINGGVPIGIPDLRDESVRDEFRNDNICTDPKIASGDSLLPSYSRGEIAIPDSVYDNEAETFEYLQKNKFRLGMN